MLALTERARPGVPWGQPGCASERSGKAEDWGQIVTAHGDRHVKPRSHDPADLPPASHKNLQRQRHLQPPRVLSLEGIKEAQRGSARRQAQSWQRSGRGQDCLRTPRWAAPKPRTGWHWSCVNTVGVGSEVLADSTEKLPLAGELQFQALGPTG